MLKENRQHNLMGLQLGLDESRTKRFGAQKPEKISVELIMGVRQSTNAYNMTAIKATNAWPIFNKKINYADEGDTQEQVEWVAGLMSAPQKERAGCAK